MKEILSCLCDVIETSGLIAKKEILGRFKDNEEMIHALNIAYNPFLITGIAKKKLSKEVGQPITITVAGGRKSLLNKPKVEILDTVDIEPTFEDLRFYFVERHTGRDADIRNIQHFIGKCIKLYSLNMLETQLLEQIITKTLTLGLNVKSINEIYGKIIPTFDCMLGSKLEDCEKQLEGKEIAVTEKLDGNRCLAVISTGVNGQTNEVMQDITFFSRNGKEIEGLEEIKDACRNLPDGVYDGELLADDFNATQSIIRTQGTKAGVCYNVFDYVEDPSEFFDSEKKEVGAKYIDRRNRLNDIFRSRLDTPGKLKLVPVLGLFIYDKDKVMQYHNMIKEKGGEGVMLNITDSQYIKDRTKNLVKVKAMKTCDVRCIGIEPGEGRLSNTLGYIICEYKGYEVRVGSGFDDATRAYYFNHQDEIVNHLVEIQYFEETKNQDETVSLRFPVFLQVRDDKDEESYN